MIERGIGWNMIGEILVLDDFIPLNDQEYMETTLLDPNGGIDWYYRPFSVYEPSNPNPLNIATTEQYKDPPQFVHHVYKNNSKCRMFDLVIPVLDRLPFSYSSIQRVKFNLLYPHKVDKHNIPHVDSTKESANISAIYYVNESSGDTLFYNDAYSTAQKCSRASTIRYRVSPKKGRLVIFDSNILHSSSTPNHGVRVVCNFVFNKY